MTVNSQKPFTIECSGVERASRAVDSGAASELLSKVGKFLNLVSDWEGEPVFVSFDGKLRDASNVVTSSSGKPFNDST
jgi:hypothetical protein